MYDEASLSVVKRNGKSEPYRRAVLKEDLVSGFALPAADADAFVRAFELDVLRRKKEVVSADSIKRLVYDFKARGPIALAIERLNEIEFADGHVFATQNQPMPTADRREFARRGPTAALQLAADSRAALIEPTNEPLSRVIRYANEIAATFVNEAVREEIDDLVGLLDPMSFVTSERRATLRRDIDAATACVFRRAPLRAAFIAALEDYAAAGARGGDQPLPTAGYDAIVDNLRRRGSELLPSDYDDDLGDGEVYRMVASLERKGGDKPLRGTNWPLYCFDRVELGDDLDGGELTFQRRNEISLYTDDLNAARDFVSVGWNPVTEFPNDLPRPYRKNLEGAETVGIYGWFLVERSTTDSILDELFEKARDKLDEKKDEIRDKAEAKFGDFLADLAPVIPLPVPDSIKKAAGQLAGGVVGWLIDLIIELLSTEARPFPSVQIVHSVLWPAGRKPLSMVTMSMRAAATDEYRQVRFSYFRDDAPNGISPYSDDLQGTVLWFGASAPAPEAPGRLFRNTAESSETAIVWRPTDGIIAPNGFGATVRQEIADVDAVYVSMLRSDLRKDRTSGSISGTGVINGS